MRRPQTPAKQFAFTALALIAGLAGSCLTAPALSQMQERYAVINGEKAPVPNIQMGDPATIARILNEGKNKNQVMEHLRVLSETYGPRLTGSTNVENAGKWARDQFEKWGLSNSHLWQWGEIGTRFDRGPSRAVVKMQVGRGEEARWDDARELEFTTLAWTKGTDGPVQGPIVRFPDSLDDADGVSYEGAWVVIPSTPPPAGGAGRRGVGGPAGNTSSRVALFKTIRDEIAGAPIPEDDRTDSDFRAKMRHVLEQNPAGFISSSGDDRVWTSGARGWREMNPDTAGSDIEVVVTQPDYDYINSRLYDGWPIQLEVDANNVLIKGPIPVYDTIAEIKGSTWPEQVVIVSAHLDSWNGPGSQGTVDNGTGSAVTLEAARILMASGAKPKRTIRFILWTGEEQGLLGSAAYVREHEEEIKATVSACFVDDGGTNYEGGLQCIESMRDYLAAATAPVNGVFFSEIDRDAALSDDDKSNDERAGWLDVNVRVTERMPRGGASDHASFNRVGVPGFFWDEVGRADYRYAWHTQRDRYDQAIAEYLVQSATCAAVTAYNLACAPELLPREQPQEEAAPENNNRGQ